MNSVIFLLQKQNHICAERQTAKRLSVKVEEIWNQQVSFERVLVSAIKLTNYFATTVKG